MFVPFCYSAPAIDLLTNSALDPFGKIPEFTYCAVQIRLAGELTPQTRYGGGPILDKVTWRGGRSLLGVGQPACHFHQRFIRIKSRHCGMRQTPAHAAVCV